MRRRPNHLYILLLSAAVLFHPKAARAQASSDLMPTAMEECEPGGCGTWVFHGKQGTGRWAAGPVGDLTIERFDAGAVSIRRVDTSGPGKGLSGLYSGTRKADNIEGTFTWIWPGGQFPAGTVNWYATIQREAHEPTHAIPVSLSMCEESDGCSTWSFQGKEGHGQWSNGASANLSAEQFGDSTVSIRRVDATGSRQGLTAFYSGTRKGDHIEGTLIWSWQHNGQYAAGTTSWHATIGPPDTKAAVANEQPGNANAKINPPPTQSNAPGPNSTGQGTSTVASNLDSSLFLEDGCTRVVPDGPPESVFDEFARGKEIQVTGLNEQTELKALAWFCKAAKDKRSHASFDSGQAAYEIGEMYLEGFVLPYTNRSQSAEPDIAIAFDWFMKAATDGNTNGMDRLAFLYMGGSQIKGNPKPKDIALSVTYLKNAVKRNDSWAILNLKLVASIGLVTLSEPETRDLSKRLDAALIKATPLENPCLSAEILDEINRLTPERDVLDVQTQSGVAIPEVAPFALYGDSFVCLAHLGPVQNEFLDHQKWGYFSGSPIEYWKYTVYMRPEGGKPLTKRAALRQMVSDYADTFATLAAPLRSQ